MENSNNLEHELFSVEEENESIASLAGVDSVRDYLVAASEAPLLSAEEEIELAKRVETGDEEARNKLICSNLRLVVSIAKKYLKTHSLSF